MISTTKLPRSNNARDFSLATAIMDSDDRSPAAGAVAQSAHIPISELSPEREDISTKSVHAVVTLVWPYSSSSQSLSLLLAEPDFRLRRSQGQVKVNFHGTSAQEVAQTHVGIGDEVHLSLKGVRWTDTQGPLATPGRNVSWDINFENHVTLEVRCHSITRYLIYGLKDDADLERLPTSSLSAS